MKGRTSNIVVVYTNGKLRGFAGRQNSVVERGTAWEIETLLSVEFIRTTLPIREATAEFRFHPVSSGTKRVEMHVWFEMSNWLAPLIKPFVRKRMRDRFSRLLVSNKPVFIVFSDIYIRNDFYCL